MCGPPNKGLASHRTRVALQLAALLLVVGPAAAQRGEPDLNILTLGWAAGHYATPVLCEFDGVTRRGIRRMLIAPGPQHARPPVNRLSFVDLDAEDAKRCFNELGEEVANLTGALQMRHPSPSRSDLASRDFSTRLKRDRGFTFRITSGRLRIAPIGPDAGEPRIVDFKDGEARLRIIPPGSDDARLLSSYPSPRKLHLELEAADGTALRFPLFLLPDS